MTSHANFWRQLNKPVFVLAPMVGVTDSAFRQVFAKYGKPDAMFTEFTSADGLCSPGRNAVLRQLERTAAEHPLVVQLHSSKPDNFREAARLVAELGFDGIDINMGCPAKEVEKFGAGAALIKKPQLAQEAVWACQDGSGGLPVSVKTRIGYRCNEIETWLPALLAAEPTAITLHARTREEASRVPARWDVVAQAVQIAGALVPDAARRPLILGNGDVDSLPGARARVAETGCDGVMIGRGCFGNPWLFDPAVVRAELPFPTVLDVMLEHTALWLSLYQGSRPFEMMKKHFKAYVGGFTGAPQVRAQLMAANDFAEVKAIVAGLDNVRLVC